MVYVYLWQGAERRAALNGSSSYWPDFSPSELRLQVVKSLGCTVHV